jgi:glycosyltransferase involved in cell wall biosynthesis
MAGPDWQGGQARLERLAERLGCRSRIHFLGPVYGDRKLSVFGMADVFVSPSRKEAFSISLVEAMSCGLPILTSTKIMLARELREANAALLTPPAARPLAQAIALLEGNPELREGLARRGKTWVQMTCDPDRAGARFREFYQYILEKH